MNFFALFTISCSVIFVSVFADQNNQHELLRTSQKNRFDPTKIIEKIPHGFLTRQEKSNDKLSLMNAATFPSDPKYATMQSYSGNNCNNYVAGFSYLLNTCIVGSSSSVKYTCDNGALTSQEFSDTACTVLVNNDFFPSGCYGGGGYSAKVVSCGSSNALAYSKASFTNVYYQDAACSSNQVVYSSALVNNYCLDFNTTSVKLDYPYENSYANNDCSGTPTSSFDVTNVQCQFSDDDYPTNYHTYEGFALAGSAFHQLSAGLTVTMVAVVATVLQLLRY